MPQICQEEFQPSQFVFCDGSGMSTSDWRIQANALVQGLFAIHPLFATHLYVGLAQRLGK
jgi:hypothetical protein